jgi:hypothetical protein
VPHPDVPMLLIAALASVAWIAVSLVVLAACRIAARSDAEATAADRGPTASGPHLRLISQALPGENVTDGAQEDLHVGPERPVGHVQVVDRSHLA